MEISRCFWSCSSQRTWILPQQKQVFERKLSKHISTNIVFNVKSVTKTTKMVELALKDAVDKFNNLPKSVQQAILGSSSGWLTGFTLVKFGRYAGFSMGASILLFQLGHHYGYINIDWKNVNRDLKKAKAEVEKQASTHIPDLSNRVQDCIKNNAVMASTFVGGFLLGASTA